MAAYTALEEFPVSGRPTKFALRDVMTEREHDEGFSLLSKMCGGTYDPAVLCEKLGSHPSRGIQGGKDEINDRIREYGGNYFAEATLKSYLELVWDALHDMTLIALLLMAVVSFFAEYVFGSHPSTGWIEPTAICISVFIIVNVGASTDYFKDRMFRDLSKSMEKSNKKQVIRNGTPLEVTDADIVVGDILAFNAHNLASIPCDGILISGSDVKMNESTLTGEPEPIPKTAGDPFFLDGKHVITPFLVSGTDATGGSGKMLVIAVGTNSVSGQIRERVYGDTSTDGDDKTPLFTKLDTMVVQIGQAGTIAALICLFAMMIIGLLIEGDDPHKIIEYVITAITILAVAVPEGLPLAVTLALAFSSDRMMKQNNLVKHLDACETMGSATTICSDKTGTLTANRMTVMGAFVGEERLLPDPGSGTVGARLAASSVIVKDVLDLLAKLIAVDTMDETYLILPSDSQKTLDFKGNPTECALLVLCRDMGYDYAALREEQEGRNEKTFSKGKPFMFSSARKMMSWAVPLPDGGWRIYSKGASEIILGRCSSQQTSKGSTKPLDDNTKQNIVNTVINVFASQAMRTIGLAYRDFPTTPDWDAAHPSMMNTNSTPAAEVETDLMLVGIVGIEDPLREEVAPAIKKCYRAGIDVRMVTGDNLDTAVAIASRCGILRDEHFEEDRSNTITGKKVKRFRAMEGREMRKRVHKPNPDKAKWDSLSDEARRTELPECFKIDERTNMEVIDPPPDQVFDQTEFDRIWPYLRVMARSSPEDKLTLANGLNKSMLFADKEVVARIKSQDDIIIFPDRQVVAMTGDGTNDAPALKRADVGFAMGLAGTQIAKDACDIVLMDDNFASIVTAAMWGRNVYDSISKFLQFQLTVNIVAIVLAIVGAFCFQESPIAAVQMLWINLIMDSLASLALATEPPMEALLERPPINRQASLITRQMWFNMLGHAFYQLSVVFVILFWGPHLFGVPAGHDYMKEAHEPSEHYTIIFNAFVMMTLFNEVNARKLQGEFNIFAGIFSNPWFIGILGSTFVLQALMCQCGGLFMKCYVGGLSKHDWVVCTALGLFSWPWQYVINVMARIFTAETTPGGEDASGLLKFSSSTGDGRIHLPAGQTSHGARSRSMTKMDLSLRASQEQRQVALDRRQTQ